MAMAFYLIRILSNSKTASISLILGILETIGKSTMATLKTTKSLGNVIFTLRTVRNFKDSAKTTLSKETEDLRPSKETVLREFGGIMF